MPFPKPPDKIVAFNSGAVAPHDIGRQFDEHRRAAGEVIDFLRRTLRDDGVVKREALPAPEREEQGRRGSMALSAPGVSPREATLPVGVLGPNAGGFYAGDDKGATATSADYAQVAIEWAEHMPDTIPPNILAINAITGNHWSSRWWANQAAQIVSSIGAGTGTGTLGVFAEAVTVTALNTLGNLTHPPVGPLLLVVNGISFLPVGSPAPFSVSGVTINWMSSIYSLIPGQTNVAAWYPF